MAATNVRNPEKRRRAGRRLAATLAAGGALALPMAVAQPAFALPGGLQYAQAHSANDSSSYKFIQASCPAGTVGVGGSALVAGTSNARINYAYPSANGYVVTAVEPRGGLTENWQLYVNAICAPPPPGLEYRTTSSVSDSASSHAVTTACSPGKKAIGMGGGVDTAGGAISFSDIVLTAVRSQSTLDSVTAAGSEDQVGSPGSWDVSATAVCANPVAGLTLAPGQSTNSSASHQSATAVCPTGTKVHSGGFVVVGAGGEADVSSFHFATDLYNNGAGVQALQIDGQEDRDGFAGNWYVLSQAICAS